MRTRHVGIRRRVSKSSVTARLVTKVDGSVHTQGRSLYLKPNNLSTVNYCALTLSMLICIIRDRLLDIMQYEILFINMYIYVTSRNQLVISDKRWLSIIVLPRMIYLLYSLMWRQSHPRVRNVTLSWINKSLFNKLWRQKAIIYIITPHVNNLLYSLMWRQRAILLTGSWQHYLYVTLSRTEKYGD